MPKEVLLKVRTESTGTQGGADVWVPIGIVPDGVEVKTSSSRGRPGVGDFKVCDPEGGCKLLT